MEACTPDLGLITTLGIMEDIILRTIIILGLSTTRGTMILGITEGIMAVDIPTVIGMAIGMEHIVIAIITTITWMPEEAITAIC